MKKDLYQEITDRIIAELENGIIPWQRPWTDVRSGAVSHSTGRPYSLLNQMLLRVPGEYVTFNQCKKEGGHVRKGAKAKMIVFWKVIIKPVLDDEGNQVVNEDGSKAVRGLPSEG